MSAEKSSLTLTFSGPQEEVQLVDDPSQPGWEEILASGSGENEGEKGGKKSRPKDRKP